MLGRAVIESNPSLLRQPILIVTGHADHEEEVALVDIRFETAPDALRVQRGINEPREPKRRHQSPQFLMAS